MKAKVSFGDLRSIKNCDTPSCAQSYSAKFRHRTHLLRLYVLPLQSLRPSIEGNEPPQKLCCFDKFSLLQLSWKTDSEIDRDNKLLKLVFRVIVGSQVKFDLHCNLKPKFEIMAVSSTGHFPGPDSLPPQISEPFSKLHHSATPRQLIHNMANHSTTLSLSWFIYEFLGTNLTAKIFMKSLSTNSGVGLNSLILPKPSSSQAPVLLRLHTKSGF